MDEISAGEYVADLVAMASNQTFLQVKIIHF